VYDVRPLVRAAFARFPLPSTPGRAWMAVGRGDQQMRVLAIIVLTLTLGGCTGDRTKQGINSPQVKSVSQSAAWSSSG
jgi:hypothetical protein